MLLVADNLALAMDHVDSEQLEKNEELKQFFDGVKLTDGCLQKELDKFGIKKYDPIGHPFDPNLHEALFEMTDPTKEKGVVAQVVQTGYMIQDRILRAAKVGVVKK
eukprot:GHVT01086827.1.p2 GENE.GHVT01086827.1~~GHVT01086827.1.p2  ORF type:complete len:106 (+),score=16.67 GHVT01086827.1:834-1151(+)